MLARAGRQDDSEVVHAAEPQAGGYSPHKPAFRAVRHWQACLRVERYRLAEWSVGLRFLEYGELYGLHGQVSSFGRRPRRRLGAKAFAQNSSSPTSSRYLASRF